MSDPFGYTREELVRIKKNLSIVNNIAYDAAADDEERSASADIDNFIYRIAAYLEDQS